MSASASRITLKPLRTSGWSSTTSTRIGAAGSATGHSRADTRSRQRQGGGHPAPAPPLAGSHPERPPPTAPPPAHPTPASPTARGTRPRPGPAASAPDPPPLALPAEPDRPPPRPRVLDGVGQCLLRHPVGGHRQVLRHRPRFTLHHQVRV